MAIITLFPAHLEARRRSVHPTAIGLRPPPFLFRAISVAPKKEDLTEGAVIIGLILYYFAEPAAGPIS